MDNLAWEKIVEYVNKNYDRAMHSIKWGRFVDNNKHELTSHILFLIFTRYKQGKTFILPEEEKQLFSFMKETLYNKCKNIYKKEKTIPLTTKGKELKEKYSNTWLEENIFPLKKRNNVKIKTQEIRTEKERE